MTVEIPPPDDFKVMKKSWEDFYSSELLNSRNPVRKIAKRPDTIVVCGVPSRWFAETRVSSKPSTLVMHTIFSALDHRFLHWTFGRVDRKQGLPSPVDFSNIYILPEFGPILSFDQVVQEAEKGGFSLPSLPANMVEMAKSVRIQKLLLLSVRRE
ncbi:uncharacterized protein LOC120694690 isoform X1 [Panicum virgatum]|uniref:uncharacterized protein LOC120694690 isoform X1 n=1 Tax=Panicum virgatum TaxID=38727 RepID=UPI0019D5BAB7|nr:uncharacterized protein LOC120694690 isoform X1 [Panicum virgatum]